MIFCLTIPRIKRILICNKQWQLFHLTPTKLIDRLVLIDRIVTLRTTFFDLIQNKRLLN
jgi:hypothetical protein